VVSRQIEEGRNGRVPAFFFCHTCSREESQNVTPARFNECLWDGIGKGVLDRSLPWDKASTRMSPRPRLRQFANLLWNVSLYLAVYG
jgi:hypothetical protein